MAGVLSFAFINAASAEPFNADLSMPTFLDNI